MSAVTATAAEQVFITCAKTQLARVYADAFPWPADPAARTSILMTIEGLRDSLGEFAGLRNGTIQPTALFFDLEAGHPDDALAEAMGRVTEDIRAWAGALAILAEAAEGEAA